MAAPVRVKLPVVCSISGVGWGLKWSVLRPGGTHQLCALGPVSPVIPGASATQSPHTHPSTPRRGRQLSSKQSAPAAQLHPRISDQAISPYHNPLNPTTSAASDLLWHSHSRAVVSARFLVCPAPRHESSIPRPNLPSRSLAAAAGTLPTSLQTQALIHPQFDSLTISSPHLHLTREPHPSLDQPLQIDTSSTISLRRLCQYAWCDSADLLQSNLSLARASCKQLERIATCLPASKFPLVHVGRRASDFFTESSLARFGIASQRNTVG
jgi:hypothetical protein